MEKMLFELGPSMDECKQLLKKTCLGFWLVFKEERDRRKGSITGQKDGQP